MYGPRTYQDFSIDQKIQPSQHQEWYDLKDRQSKKFIPEE